MLDNLKLANDVLLHIKSRNNKKAAKNIQTLLENNANIGKHWGAITRLALSIGEIKLALLCANQYLALNPNSLNTRLQVAAIYAEANRPQKAINIVEPFLTANIQSANLFHFLGTTYSQLGENEKALFFLKNALKLTPNLGIGWLTLATIYKFTPNDQYITKLAQLESEISGDNLQTDIPYWFAYGKALLDLNEVELAFDKFSIGCKKAEKHFHYSPQQHHQIINTIISQQTKDYFSKSPPFPKHSEKIIFIIGLPRSGTTLLEQILAAHSKISSGGETNCMTIALSKYGAEASRLTSLNELTEQRKQLQNIYHHYKHLLNEKYSSTNLIIDKTLNLNHQLGIIQQVFPNAIFIKINRDPKTTAWSCFRTFFSSGLSWSYDLDNIKHFFQYEDKLFTHWRTLFSDNILEISYEDLIAAPQKVIEQCCIHIGVDFEENMLQFYNNKNFVKTASVGQVRQAIHNHSIKLPDKIAKHFSPF